MVIFLILNGRKCSSRFVKASVNQDSVLGSFSFSSISMTVGSTARSDIQCRAFSWWYFFIFDYEICESLCSSTYQRSIENRRIIEI